MRTLPLLLCLLLPASAPQEEAHLRSLCFLARMQQADGSWDPPAKWPGGLRFSREATTGMCLNVFLGAGYSHLSKDTYHDICWGDVLRNGLRFLLKKQKADGSLGGNLIDHAMGTLALTEAYGLTGSNLFKNQAQKAADHLSSMRLSERPPLGLAFAMTVWHSIRTSGLRAQQAKFRAAEELLIEWKRGTRRRPKRAPDTSPKDGRLKFAVEGVILYSNLLLGRKPDPVILKRLAGRTPAWNQPRPLQWLFDMGALYLLDGPKGPGWKKFSGHMKTLLLRNMVSGEVHEKKVGSWLPKGFDESARVLLSALFGMELMIYYRYANHFFADRPR